MNAIAMAHAKDPKAELLDQVGDLSKVELFHNQVLVAVYKRPEKTAGGLILTQQTRDEDELQGKIGLILKTGDRAFVPDANWSWPENMGEGDWIFFRASDGWAMKINGVMCRVLDDVRVRGRVSHPDQVW
jgi:co-chaperonin GroES (HSP10)